MISINPISVSKDKTIELQGNVRIHLSYEDELTLKELSELLDLINKSINDFNRSNGVNNNSRIGKEYSTQVKSVESGSIVVNLLLNVVSPVLLSVLANYIYDRIKTLGKGKGSNTVLKYPITINVNGDNNELNVLIDNKKE